MNFYQCPHCYERNCHCHIAHTDDYSLRQHSTEYLKALRTRIDKLIADRELPKTTTTSNTVAPAIVRSHHTVIHLAGSFINPEQPE